MKTHTIRIVNIYCQALEARSMPFLPLRDSPLSPASLPLLPPDADDRARFWVVPARPRNCLWQRALQAI